jgi:hypothetical protein
MDIYSEGLIRTGLGAPASTCAVSKNRLYRPRGAPQLSPLAHPEMERERSCQGERAGKKEQGCGEVSRGPLQLADDDRPGKSTAIADGVDQASPAAAPVPVRIEDGSDQNVPMAA